MKVSIGPWSHPLLLVDYKYKVHWKDSHSPVIETYFASSQNSHIFWIILITGNLRSPICSFCRMESYNVNWSFIMLKFSYCFSMLILTLNYVILFLWLNLVDFVIKISYWWNKNFPHYLWIFAHLNLYNYYHYSILWKPSLKHTHYSLTFG